MVQQKFLKLFQEISLFFAGERQLQDKDTANLTQARTSMLELTRDAASPAYDRFLTFLLGTTEIQADYPMQAIRMACLAAKALLDEKITPEQRQEILTAALVADTGFRPAWLGHHGQHYDITTYQLKSLGIPWYSAGIDRLIASHHKLADDISPFKILSLLAFYLGKVYGTGIEDVGQPLVSPASGVRMVMTELHPEANNLRVFLKAVGAFPLGSWVTLNTRQPALILGGNAKNPLKPRIGIFRDGKGPQRWEEVDLEKNTKLHIVSEIEPTAEQRSLLNYPELLVPGWIAPAETADQRPEPPSAQVVNAHSTTHEGESAIPANMVTAEEYRQHLLKKSRPTPEAVISPDPAPTSGAGGWPTSDGPGGLPSKLHLLKFYREELISLRNTWEQQVRAAEQVTTSLKSPLLESYRRENELMAAMLDRIQAIETDVSTSATERSVQAEKSEEPFEEESPAASPIIADVEPARTPDRESAVAVADDTTLMQLSEDPATGLREIHSHLMAFQDQIDKDQGILRQIKDRFHQSLRHLEGGQSQVLPSLLTFARQWRQKLEAVEQSFALAEQEETALTIEWNSLRATTSALTAGPRQVLLRSWKDPIKPRMERVLTAAQRALSAHHQRLTTHAEMIERFCSEAHQLTRN